MMERLILSVDGGGSKTCFLAAAPDGSPRYHAEAGATSHKSVGRRKASANLHEGLCALKQQGLDRKSLMASVFGLSGCDTPADREFQMELLRKEGFREDNTILCNDAVLALYAQCLPPGIVVVAGTGCICVGIDENGQMHRVGGWGYDYSDLGGGQWMGAAVLSQALLYCDGCRSYDPVFDAVMASAGVSDTKELRWWAADIKDQTTVAALARTVFETDSPLAGELLEKGAGLVALQAAGLLKAIRYEGQGDYRVVLAGGLFHSEAYHRAVVSQLCRLGGVPPADIVKLAHPPVEGGIRLGAQFLSKQKDAR